MRKKLLGLPLIAAMLVSATSTAWAATIWNVDASQSYLQLSIPNQPWAPNGQLFINNQQSSASGWTLGREASISGTISTDFENGSSIRFRDGEHLLVADNSGVYTPDVEGGGSASAPGAFAGQVNSTQVGVLPVVGRWFNFVIRDVGYNLDSGIIPLVGNTFSTDATTFSMEDSVIGIRGAQVIGTSFLEYGTTDEYGFLVGGTNAANIASISSAGNVLTLMMPVSVPLTWNYSESGVVLSATGTATGVIVATTIVPEPTTIATAAIGGIALLCCAWRTRRRNR